MRAGVGQLGPLIEQYLFGFQVQINDGGFFKLLSVKVGDCNPIYVSVQQRSSPARPSHLELWRGRVPKVLRDDRALGILLGLIDRCKVRDLDLTLRPDNRPY